MPASPADIRNAVLLSVAALAAGILVPLIPYVGMPLAAFALAWFAYRFGYGAATGLALIASVPLLVLGPVLLGTQPMDAIFVIATMLAAGPGAAWALERYPAYAVVAGVALVTAGAFMAVPLGRETLAAAILLYREVFKAAAESGSVADTSTIQPTVTALVNNMKLGWPSTTLYTMGMSALLSVPLVARVGRMLGRRVNRYPALHETDLSFHVVWPTIAGLALVAAGLTWGGSRGLVYAVGYNVLMIMRPVLFLQGLAVFASLYRRMNAGPVWRWIGYVLLAFTELALPSVSVLGAVDLFVNLRKLPRKHAPSL